MRTAGGSLKRARSPVTFVLYCVTARLPARARRPARAGLVLPLYFLKLLVAHLLPEEAYRPIRGKI